MEFFLEDLNKEELRSIMKSLSIEYLREPVLSDHKLEKKYITGFRATNVTYVQLVQLYYKEIKVNVNVKKAINNAICSHLKSCKLYDLFENFSTEMTWDECTQIGILISESDCEIPLNLLLKITGKSIAEDKKGFLIKLQEYGQKRKANQEDLIASYEEKITESTNLVDKLKKEVSSAECKKEQALLKKNELEKNVKALTNVMKNTEIVSETLGVEIAELKVELEKKNKELEQAERSLSIQMERMKEKETTIRELLTSNSQMEEKYRTLEEQKIMRYDEAIIRLVSDTIDDLKEKYDVDIEEFDRILSGIEGEKNISTVWQYISSINLQLIENVEGQLRTNSINMEIIDSCNEVENFILVKYVMIKAIKSLHFEYMSNLEKNQSILKEIRK